MNVKQHSQNLIRLFQVNIHDSIVEVIGSYNARGTADHATEVFNGNDNGEQLSIPCSPVNLGTGKRLAKEPQWL